jgi:D-Tyr-tRNAtyr deacylase
MKPLMRAVIQRVSESAVRAAEHERIFEDQHGKMNLSLLETGGQMQVALINVGPVTVILESAP